MSKDLEEAINRALKTKQRGTCIISSEILEGVLNHIDNSIPIEAVENKLNEQRSKVTNKCMYCNHDCDKYDVCTALQELLEGK